MLTIFKNISDKSHVIKKSKIPLLKFKQTVEKVQKEQQKNVKEVSGMETFNDLS